MNRILDRIIGIEKEAQTIGASATEEKDRMERDVLAETEKIKEGLEKAFRKEKQECQKKADGQVRQELARLQAEYEEKSKAMSELFAAHAEAWKKEITEEIIGA